MIGAFSFKNIPSSNFDLICKSVTRPLLPTRRSTITRLPRSSGVHDSGGNEYDERVITMKIQYLGTDFYELRSRAHAIAAWLGTEGWGELRITGEEDKYYWAKIEDEIDMELMDLVSFGACDINFMCQPFAYGNDITLTGVSPIIFNYEGTRHINFRSPDHASFKITFIPPGEFTLNGVTVGYSDANGGANITLDNVDMSAAGGTFSFLTGSYDRFLEIKPGQNSLSYTGATGVQVVYRPMYY